jgi:hypothetical protein
VIYNSSGLVFSHHPGSYKKKYGNEESGKFFAERIIKENIWI